MMIAKPHTQPLPTSDLPASFLSELRAFVTTWGALLLTWRRSAASDTHAAGHESRTLPYARTITTRADSMPASQGKR